MILSITGTPGTGKTYISKKLCKSIKCKYLDLNSLIKKEKLYESYDRLDKTFIVDEKKLSKLMNKILFSYKYKTFQFNKYFTKAKNKKTLQDCYSFFELSKILKKISEKDKNIILIDSHLSHYIDSDLCIVIRSDIKTLNKRLKKRKYSNKKILDNIESEIFEICLVEAQKFQKNILQINN